MIEIYLFIHPLCSESLASEKKFLKIIQTGQQKVQFKFLPYLNLHSFQHFLMKHQLGHISIDARNKLFQCSYSAALDYKAIQFQGKKKGRVFLLTLQELVCQQDKIYTTALVEEIVQSIGGDLNMFRSDRLSSSVKEAFQADQDTAKEMNVNKDSSAVIFNYACERDFGVLLEEFPSTEIFSELLKTNKPSKFKTYTNNNHFARLNDYPLHLIQS